MARKESLPYYKWFWRDWRSNRRVQRMSWQARGLYRELLDEFWSEGVLPVQIDVLSDICGCPLSEFTKYWPEIEGCFVVTDCGLINPKMDEQRTDTDALRAARARNGRDGALAKLASAKQVLASATPVLANASNSQQVPYSRAEQSRADTDPEQQATPVFVVPIADHFDPSMLCGAVLMETGLSGQQVAMALVDLGKLEERDGKNLEPVRDALIGAWQSYVKARDDGKLRYHTSAAKFFSEGLWRSEDGWPWKEQRNGSTGDNRQTGNRVSPAAERGINSRTTIDAAVARAINRSAGAVDGRNAGGEAQPGTSSGDSGHVPGRVAGDGVHNGSGRVSPRTIEGNP